MSDSRDRFIFDGTDLGSVPHIEVKKWGATVPISRDMAMDYGLIPDDRPPAPPIPRRTRLRWWLSAHRPVLHFGACNHDDCY